MMKPPYLCLSFLIVFVFGLAVTNVSFAATPATIYVDNQSAVGGDGSELDPVDTIQEGVDLAAISGIETVCVVGGGVPYVEDVTVVHPTGVAIYGTAPACAHAKNPFEGGIMPEVIGGFMVDGIRSFRLIGFSISSGFGGENGVDVSNVGVVEVSCNTVYATGGVALFESAILVRTENLIESEIKIAGNKVTQNDSLGIAVLGEDDSKLKVEIASNTLSKNGGTGIRMSLAHKATGDFSATRNRFSGNGNFGFGISAGAGDNSQGTFFILKNSIQRAGAEGLNISAYTKGHVEFLATDNKIEASGNTGVALSSLGSASLKGNFANNTSFANQNGGIVSQTTDNAFASIKYDGNLVFDNETYGFRFSEAEGSTLIAGGEKNNSTVPGNAGNELECDGSPGGAILLNGGIAVLPVTIP